MKPLSPVQGWDQLCVGEQFPARPNSTPQPRDHTVTSNFCNLEITKHLAHVEGLFWWLMAGSPRRIQAIPSQRPLGSKFATQRSQIYGTWLVQREPRAAGWFPIGAPSRCQCFHPIRPSKMPASLQDDLPRCKRPSRTHRCKVSPSGDAHLRSYRVPGRLTSSGFSTAWAAKGCVMCGGARSAKGGWGRSFPISMSQPKA